MRRAGQATFDHLRATWPHAKCIAVYCGTGNNAGDGYILAGLALNAGLAVQLRQVGDSSKLKGDAKKSYDWVVSLGLEEVQSSQNEAADVVVDALLGTGSSGPARPEFAAAIKDINQSSVPVLSLDMPSGINANTGTKLFDPVVRADQTVTFLGAKIGLYCGEGANHAGFVHVADLDVPEAVYACDLGIDVLPRQHGMTSLPRRVPSAHKNQTGHVLVIGGDFGTGGAPILAAEAALRTGAGLVSVVTRPETVNAALARIPEAMVRGVHTGEHIRELLDRADVVVIGPGLGTRRWSVELLKQVLDAELPVVLDADGLNLFAANEFALPDNSICTPHPGEASRLLAVSGDEIEGDRLKALESLIEKLQSTVVLKGAGTLVGSSKDEISMLPRAIPSLATAGSGDVLAGMCGAALAILGEPQVAAEVAVVLHAESAVRAQSSVLSSITATDLIRHIKPW